MMTMTDGVLLDEDRQSGRRHGSARYTTTTHKHAVIRQPKQREQPIAAPFFCASCQITRKPGEA